MKKVMFVLPRMNGGGVERVVSVIANNLAMRNYDVFVVVLVGSNSFYSLNEKIRFITANISLNRQSSLSRKISMLKGICRSISFVKKTINEYEPDVIIPLLTECELICYLATLGSSKLARICSERSDPSRDCFITKKFKKHIYKHSNLLVCQSVAVSKFYKDIPEVNKRIIPNPIDFSMMPQAVPESIPLRVVSVGRLRPEKNMSLLVKAFSLIAGEFGDATLTIYGEGPERKALEKMICKLNMSGRVFLPGVKPDVLEQIKDAALFVLPSNYEGFPNVLLEAMALKLPVISTDFASGVAREIVTSEVGEVVPCGNPILMANAMRKFLSNLKLRQMVRMRDIATLHMFDKDNVVLQWVNAVESVTCNIA